ncbi:MAG: hypothetical protein EOO86_01550 [Pedobacter sp.]|nr:MAG: hypothetical protein EOO86_01550 [Pedobacter sp.]
MDKINLNEDYQLDIDNPITDCSHLIDSPSGKSVFSNKLKGAEPSNPKATIKILTVYYPKNGLANLL